MEEVEEIDVELLISLFHDRLVMWDKRLEQYKSQVVITTTWRELCSHMNLERFFFPLTDK